MEFREVLSLPALVCGARRLQLPMCDATAMSLASVLADENPIGRADALSAAMAADPALAVWGVWCAAINYAEAGATFTDFPKTIATLSSFLVPRLLDLFEQNQGESVVPFTVEQHGRFASLVAESVAAAHEALRGSGREDPISEPAYLSALTARWREWLAAATPTEAATGDELPRWPLDAPQSNSNATPNSQDSRAADQAWRRWLTEIPGIHFLLPAMIAQLSRRRDLEADFAHLLHQAKLDALKEFAYGAGHELNNPLANIASRAQTLLAEETNPERRRRLAAINTQAFRAHEMLADMMLFARPPQLALSDVDLVQLINHVLAELADDAAAQQAALSGPTRCDALSMMVDPVQLRVALRALCVNSLQALGQGGHVSIELCRGDAESVSADRKEHARIDSVQIIVSDDGPGIPTDIRDKIFDPFFSGREAGRGLGFGLSKCWRIVTLHGGTIDVQSDSPHGATFTITLPGRRGTA